MDRRQAVKNVAFLIGGALSATTLASILQGCNNTQEAGAVVQFSKEELDLITEIADVILPTTEKSPGAKAAGVGPFIPMMLQDCFPADIGPLFKEGLKDVEARANKNFSKNFAALTDAQKIAIIEEVRVMTLDNQKLEREANEAKQKLEAERKAPDHKKPGSTVGVVEKPKGKSYFFVLIRDLTILGFSTSEVGATQAYAFNEIPGRYDGCVDLKPGQKLWA